MQGIGYIRVSTDDQAREGVSLDVQAERIRAYADMAEIELVGVVCDKAISGTIPLADRPGGADLLQHDVKHVIALKLDRLFRDAADALNQTRQWDREVSTNARQDSPARVLDRRVGQFRDGGGCRAVPLRRDESRFPGILEPARA